MGIGRHTIPKRGAAPVDRLPSLPNPALPACKFRPAHHRSGRSGIGCPKGEAVVYKWEKAE